MFESYASVSLGPFQVQMQMLGLILAIVVGFLMFTNRLKLVLPNEKETIANQAQTSLLIAIILYKCWPFIQDPTLLTSFSSIIFYSGGPYAVIVALAGAILWFGYQWWKNSWPLHIIDELALSGMFGWVTYLLVVKQFGAVSPFSIGWQKEGVVFHPVNLYEAGMVIVFVCFAFYSVDQSKKGARAFFFAVGFILIKAVLAPFKN